MKLTDPGHGPIAAGQEADIIEGTVPGGLRLFEEAMVCYNQALALGPQGRERVDVREVIALEWLERFEGRRWLLRSSYRPGQGRALRARPPGQVLADWRRYDEADLVLDKRRLEMGLRNGGPDRQGRPTIVGRNEDIIKVCDKIVKYQSEERGRLGGPGNGQLRSNNFAEAVALSTPAPWRWSRGHARCCTEAQRRGVKGNAEENVKVCEDILRIDMRNKTALIDKAGALEPQPAGGSAQRSPRRWCLDKSDPQMYPGARPKCSCPREVPVATQSYDTTFSLNHEVDSLANKGHAVS